MGSVLGCITDSEYLFKNRLIITCVQLLFSYSKPIMKTPEQCVKYVQNSSSKRYLIQESSIFAKVFHFLQKDRWLKVAIFSGEY